MHLKFLGFLTLAPALFAQSALLPAGSMAQIASGQGWTTTITLVNSGSAVASARLNFYDDNGSPLALPFTFPQTSVARALQTAAVIDGTLNPGSQLVLVTTGPANQPIKQGWAQLSTDGSVSGFAVFTSQSGAPQEAVAPLEARNPDRFVITFDNTGGNGTGIALANVSASPALIPVVIRDDTAASLGSGSLSMQGHAHLALIIVDQYPATAGKRGTIEFSTPAGGQISALGLKFLASGAFSSLPAVVLGSGQGSVPAGPVITGVSAILPQQTQTITISGNGFGTMNPYNGDSSFLEITDVTANWNAGWSNSTGSNLVTLNVTSWTDSQIVVQGFTGQYGLLTYRITAGDQIQVRVWNVQTATGPAVYTLNAKGASGANSPLAVTTAAELPQATVGKTYQQQLTASGGVLPYTWGTTLTLPPGITLSSSGSLSGTPATAGPSVFTATVVDATGQSAATQLVLTVASASSPAAGGSSSPLLILPYTLSLSTIEPGMSTRLGWSSTYKSVTISPGIGKVASYGNIDLRPTVTTQYIILYEDPNAKAAQDTVTVTVVPSASIQSFTATPATISSGGVSPARLGYEQRSLYCDGSGAIVGVSGVQSAGYQPHGQPDADNDIYAHGGQSP